MTDMKRINLAPLLLFLLTLAACGGKQADTTRLEGEIKGLGNDTLYLYGTDRLYDRTDTLPLHDGRFSATLTPDTAVTVRLLLPDGTAHPLFLGKGEKLRIVGDTARLEALEVTGSLPNEELTAYLKALNAITPPPTEEELEARADSFIRTHPASPVSVYLLERYFVQQSHPDRERIQRLVEGMTGELKDRPRMEQLMSQIKEEEKTLVGKIAPSFRLPDAEGKLTGRTDFKDQYVLVHFWASWDTLSRRQNALYRRIYKQEQKNKQFALLGISLDVDRAAWRTAVEQDTLKWTQLCDFKGWNADIAKQLALQALPASLLLSPTGRIEGRNLDEQAIDKKLKEIAEQEKAKKEREKERKNKNKKKS